MKTIVSIIIPFYENYFFLERAIKSVLNQSFKKYEIIIIHDNPGDNNFNKLKNLKKKYPKKINIIFNNQNIGAGLSRNKGIKLSKGEYVAFLDSDDIWHKKKLLVQINFMRKNGYHATHTSYNLVDLKGKYISSRIAKNLNYQKLINSCDIGLSTVIIKKNILKMKQPFPPLKTKEDYVLWLNITKRNIIFYGINQKLTFWTNTPGSLSKSITQKIADSIRVYSNYEKFSFLNSLLKTLILSVNYLKKK
tara:strand:- start:9709 stop:10455 length:747 start_codon:yes stop_codon:yes gene_type:complete